MERSDSITLVTLDHFSHFTLKAFGKPLSGAIQSLALWARIFTSDHPDMAVTILRPCFVVGPGFDNPLARYLQKPVVILPRQTAPFQFVHEDDLIRVMLQCLEDTIPGIFNVAGEGTIALPDAVRLLGNRTLHLPIWLMVPLNSLFWLLRFRFITEFPSPGFNLIRYPWIASPQRFAERTGFKYHHDSRSAFADFARTVNQA